MRTTKNISITLPPSLLREAEKIAKDEGRTQSELFREALRHYVWKAQFRRLQEYGTAQSKKLGLKPSDVPRLIQEYRAQKAKSHQ